MTITTFPCRAFPSRFFPYRAYPNRARKEAATTSTTFPYRARKEAARARLALCTMFVFALSLIALPVTANAQKPGSANSKRIRPNPNAAPINLFEKHKKDYKATPEPAIIDIPPARYLTLVGKGAPGGESFVKKVGVMYGVAYGVKMTSKYTGRDFTIGILEALWWGNADKHEFVNEPRDTWNWKILIRVPEFITEASVRKAAAGFAKRSPGTTAPDVKLETITEGKCVQVLHVGPYATEPATIAAMKALAKAKGLSLTGKHHEIYLGDPNKTAPEKLKTILRQPVK